MSLAVLATSDSKLAFLIEPTLRTHYHHAKFTGFLIDLPNKFSRPLDPEKECLSFSKNESVTECLAVYPHFVLGHGGHLYQYSLNLLLK